MSAASSPDYSFNKVTVGDTKPNNLPIQWRSWPRKTPVYLQGGIIMISKLFSLATAVLIALFLWPSGGHAQTLTPLEECIEGFYAAVDEWASTVPVMLDGTCYAEKGEARVILEGLDATEARAWNFASRLFRKPDKECTVKISRWPVDGGIYMVTGEFLSGKEASQWNKFLKSEGCIYALNKIP
jgi:hypothetical protein